MSVCFTALSSRASICLASDPGKMASDKDLEQTDGEESSGLESEQEEADVSEAEESQGEEEENKKGRDQPSCSQASKLTSAITEKNVLTWLRRNPAGVSLDDLRKMAVRDNPDLEKLPMPNLESKVKFALDKAVQGGLAVRERRGNYFKLAEQGEDEQDPGSRRERKRRGSSSRRRSRSKRGKKSGRSRSRSRVRRGSRKRKGSCRAKAGSRSRARGSKRKGRGRKRKATRSCSNSQW